MSDAAGDGRLFRTPAGVRLCTVEDVVKRGSHSLVLQIGERYFHGFLIARHGAVIGYVDSCPHMGLSLESSDRQYLSPDGSTIVCARHGAMFDLATGACLGGPCVGARLQSWPVRTADGFVWTD